MFGCHIVNVSFLYFWWNTVQINFELVFMFCTFKRSLSFAERDGVGSSKSTNTKFSLNVRFFHTYPHFLLPGFWGYFK